MDIIILSFLPRLDSQAWHGLCCHVGSTTLVLSWIVNDAEVSQKLNLSWKLQAIKSKFMADACTV